MVIVVFVVVGEQIGTTRVEEDVVLVVRLTDSTSWNSLCVVVECRNREKISATATAATTTRIVRTSLLGMFAAVPVSSCNRRGGGGCPSCGRG